jgi:hypothetical protein
MSAYLEKLKDPRWQKKRLAVLNREGFQCQSCRSSSDTLHIHHLVYSSGEPWECPDDDLECLCEWCHTMREMFNEMLEGRSKIPTVFFLTFLKFVARTQKQSNPKLDQNDLGGGFQWYWNETLRNYSDRHTPKPEKCQ